MHKGHIIYIICATGGLFWNTFTPSEASALHDIWSHIFNDRNYNKNVRPVQNENSVTDINISMALISVIDFSEVKQTITVATKLTLTWRDEFLTWNASNFSGVEHTHVYQQDIWKPSIFLENSVVKQAEFGSPSLHVAVGHDGVVDWRTLEVFETTCMTDVTQFPFDQQSCSLIFEPFGYTDSEIKITAASDHIEIHSYGGAAGWSIGDTELETAEGDEGIHVIASLSLKRNPIYMVLNIMLPIACLSLLNNCVFLLPVQSGEKASFAVTVFLALAVFLTIVSQQLPENSDHASLLNIYVILNSLASVIIAILTLLQIRIYHRDPKLKVPECLAKIAVCCSSKRCTITQTQSNEDKLFTPVTKISHGTASPVHDHDKFFENGKADCDGTKTFHNDVTWPDFVKALDNILFICFMVMYVAITSGFLFVSVYGKYNRYSEEHDSDTDH